MFSFSDCFQPLQRKKTLRIRSIKTFNQLFTLFCFSKSDVSYFTFWSITTAFLASFQGFFAALFYCFCNKEVSQIKSQQIWKGKYTIFSGSKSGNQTSIISALPSSRYPEGWGSDFWNIFISDPTLLPRPDEPSADPELAAGQVGEYEVHQGEALSQKVGNVTKFMFSIFTLSRSTKKRPSWCQEVPSSSGDPTQSYIAGEAVGWSPRGRSIDLRACGPIRGLTSVEEGPEVQALSL